MDALRSVLPAGTLCGAPKVRAMQIIDELEPVKRGGYGGAIGYLSYTGDLDTCIHIRTVVVKDGIAHVQAGGGTVADAKPDYEFRRVRGQGAAVSARDRAGDGAAGLAMSVSVLVVDNYDSFTYNLVQYLGELGAEIDVVRNDRATVDELLARRPDRVVVSPGPCTPDEAGISLEAMRRFPEAGVPTLGVCLGHQSLAQAFGGTVVRHEPVHGKTTTIEHDGRTIFAGLRRPLTVGRYHSLVVRGGRCPTASRSPPAAAASSWASATASCPPRACSSTPSRCSPRRQATAAQLPGLTTGLMPNAVLTARDRRARPRAATSPPTRPPACSREIMAGDAPRRRSRRS